MTWLLTREEMAKAYFAAESTPSLPSEAMCRAQARKILDELETRIYGYAPERRRVEVEQALAALRAELEAK